MKTISYCITVYNELEEITKLLNFLQLHIRKDDEIVIQYDESSVNVQAWLNDANAWEVAVYPNPTSTTLNVRFIMPKEDEVSIGLYDMQGKQVLLKNLGNKSFGSHQEMLDLTDIPNGTYVCRISGKYNSITKQVIKQ